MNINYIVDFMGSLTGIYIDDFEKSDIVDNTLKLIVPNIVNGNIVLRIGNNATSLNGLIYGSDKVYKKANDLNLKCFELVLPESVTHISKISINDKFNKPQAKYLKLKIPKNVQEIAEHALNCNIFAEFSFEEPSNITELKRGVFAVSTFKEKFFLPSHCTSIGEGCFADSYFEKGIELENSAIEVFKAHSFKDAILNADKIFFSDNVTYIGYCAFACVNDLKSIETSPNSKLNVVDTSAFLHCSSLESVVLRSTVDNLMFKDYCFSNCRNLSVLDLSGVNTVSLPTQFCSNSSEKYMDVIKLPKNLKTIGSYAFHKTKIKDIIFPCSIEVIDSNAFSESLLQTIEFEDLNNLTKLGNSAFEYCILESIPSNIFSCCEKVGDYVFAHNNFRELKLNAPSSRFIQTDCGSASVSIFEGSSLLKNVKLINDNENKWKGIGPQMFSDCVLLEQIDIPDTVTEIRRAAFRKTAFKSISLNAYSLGEGVFEECRLLEVCELSNINLKEILPDTFKKTVSIKQINLSRFSNAKISKKAFFRYKDERIYKIFKESPFIMLI